MQDLAGKTMAIQVLFIVFPVKSSSNPERNYMQDPCRKNQPAYVKYEYNYATRIASHVIV